MIWYIIYFIFYKSAIKNKKKLYMFLYIMYNYFEVISLNLKKVLNNKGIKQADLAKKLKISRQSLRYKIKSWEEKRKGFSIDELIIIAKSIDESLNFFL